MAALSLLLLAPAGARAQTSMIAASQPGYIEAGTPPFVVLGPEALGLSATPVDLHQMPDGRLMVFGHGEFALGDGVRWEVFRQAHDDPPINTASVAVDAAGRIYAGMAHGFGRVEFRPDGQWRVARVERLPDDQGAVAAPLTSVAMVGADWYWSFGSGPIITWKPGDPPKTIGRLNALERVFALGPDVYVSDQSNGDLFRLEEGALRPDARRFGRFVEQVITSAVPMDDGRSLVGTINLGLLRHDASGFHPFVTGGPLAGAHRISDLCAVGGDWFAVAVDNVGVVFIDRNGRIVQTLDRYVDNRLARVKRLLPAPGGVIWALLNEGIARIGFPSRFSSFEPMVTTGLAFSQPYRHDGRLWLLADGRAQRGVYDADHRLIRFDVDTPGPYLTSLVELAGDWVATTEDGIFRHEADGRWQRVAGGPVSPHVRPMPVAPNLWLYIAQDEVGWLRRSGERYAFERFPVAGLGHVYGATPDARGEFWAELGTGRVARVAATAPRPTVEVFGPGEGMTEAWAQVFLVGGEIRVNAHDQILRLDRGRHRFVPDQALVDRFPSLEGALGRPVDDARGRLWITRPDNLVVVDPRSPSTPPSVEAVPEGLRPLYFTPQADGVVWMNEPMRLARYDPALPVPAAPPVRALITRVDLPESGIVLFPVDGRIPNLPAGTGTLGVHYLAAPAPYGRPLDFEVRLSGAEGRWVSTGSAGSVTFNALDPGVYQLRVRPRLGADAGEEARLDFAILAPWYRTRPAYVLYGLSVVGGVGLVIWLGTFFVRREKDRLERLVVRRTGELNRQILETSEKTAALGASEERFRRLNAELEARVAERTAQLGAKVADVERLNAEQQALMRDLRSSQQATDRSAARLQEVNASLMAANQELEAFSYSVSHDLRAPLRNITGFLELLERRTTGRLDAEAARFITVVHTEVARMGLLIDDLLTFSRVGREEMHLQAVALDPLVGEVRAQLAAEVGERAIDWAIGPLPSVRGDPALLRQVFVNLLSNAIKFTRRAPAARIEVGAAVPARGDRTVVIFVRDNGAGFNPKYLGRLFGVFQRLHSARDFEGTGIGLANVKRIVTRHGGRVWAEGQVDQGATFYLKLAAAEP